MLFSAITKNSNWEISAKKLVKNGVRHERMKNFNFFWDSIHKNKGVGQFADLRGEGLFFRGIDNPNPHHGYILGF